MEDVTPELKHDALGSLRNIKVDVAGFTGLQLSGKAGIQLSAMEEVRKTLKEHIQASIKKLEVHDLCFAWQKVSDTDLKPLMEKLVNSFAESQSPFSSYTDRNLPSPEFPEGRLFLIATENTACKPHNQAPSSFSSTPFLLLRISLDIETLDKLVEQHQATLKPPNGLDSKSQSQAPKPDSKDSSSVYISPRVTPCDNFLVSDGSFKQPWQSSKVVTNWDCQSLKVPILQPDGVNSSCHLKTSAELLWSAECVVDEPLQNLQLPKMQAQEFDISKDKEDDCHDVVILELQDFEHMDQWRPWVEEDGDLTDLEFLFPAYVKYKDCVSSEEEDERDTVVLKPRVKVQETPTQCQKAASPSQPESSLRFRAEKGGLKKSSIGITELTRGKQAVTFAEEAQTDTYDDDEDEIFPCLKSWEIQDSKETQLLSKEHKQQPEPDKLPICKTHIPQSSKHWISITQSATPESSEEETGIMHDTIPSCGIKFTCSRELLELYKSKKERSRNRTRNTCVIPKETAFGGSALTDAQQIRKILRASHKTFADLSTFELFHLEFD